MENLASPVTVAVTFKDAAGNTVAAPAGVTFVSSATGVDTLAFTDTQKSDGTYDLVVSPGTPGTDTVTASGLTGSLSVTVTAAPAVSVEFNPPSV
jgi:hypothetical protein